MPKYKQLVPFTLKNMGTKRDWCLANVREGFGIPAKYPDAKAAMEANKKASLLHPITTLPDDVAVPVFIDTPSVWEHVIVSDKGKFYSDGKQLTSLDGLTIFGWGESLNGVRIVESIPEPTPAPAPEPIKDDSIKVGDMVVPTELVDYNGIPLKQYDNQYMVYQINGDRAVLTARGQIWAAMNIKSLRRA